MVKWGPSGGPAGKTLLWACTTLGFGLGTSLGTPFTMMPPCLFHRLSQDAATICVSSRVVWNRHQVWLVYDVLEVLQCSSREIPWASPSRFPSGSGYISLYIPPIFTIQIQDTATLCVSLRDGRELTSRIANVCWVRSLAVFQVAKMQLNYYRQVSATLCVLIRGGRELTPRLASSLEWQKGYVVKVRQL